MVFSLRDRSAIRISLKSQFEISRRSRRWDALPASLLFTAFAGEVEAGSDAPGYRTDGMGVQVWRVRRDQDLRYHAHV